MSMVLTRIRSPLEPITMNGAGTQKRRSARLSHEGADDPEPPTKRSRTNGAETAQVSTKTADGDPNAMGKRKPRKVYDKEVEGFSFKKKSKTKESKQPAVRHSDSLRDPSPTRDVAEAAPRPSTPEEDAAPKTAQKKSRRRFPTTPEREDTEKPIRRSKRLSNENAEPNQQSSPFRPSHKKAKQDRSPSPGKARPVTVEKKRKRGANGLEEEEKTMRIPLPFQDTPVIRRNKDFRKSSAEGHRRSSSGMRGRRASSLIDEGRGNALPHTEVPTSEFYKHISADLPEPRRMRCLLGWCGSRALPPKPEAPKDNTPASNLEFQALQLVSHEPSRIPWQKTQLTGLLARVIQEELSLALTSNGALSEWFSRDETAEAPKIPLRKKPNPRNITNAAKAEELEKELERLKKERASWDELKKTAISTTSAPPKPTAAVSEVGPEDNESGTEPLSPIRPDLLDTPQRSIFATIQIPAVTDATQPDKISEQLQNFASDLEFNIDSFADGVHVMSSTRETAERLADVRLGTAAQVLEERHQGQKADAEKKGKAPLDAMESLKALGRPLLNPSSCPSYFTSSHTAWPSLSSGIRPLAQLILCPTTTLGCTKLQTNIHQTAPPQSILNSLSMGHPAITHHPLHRADGSTSYTCPNTTETILASVNGPIEVQRRDEVPDECFVEVNLRPANGVGGPRERWLEGVVAGVLRSAVLLHLHPRMMIQVTLQQVGGEGTGKGKRAWEDVGVLPGLLNAANLALVDAGIPMGGMVSAVLVAVDLSGRISLDPGKADVGSSKSVHAFAFNQHGDMLLNESVGGFSMEEWNAVAEAAEKACVSALGKGSEDYAMADGGVSLSEPGKGWLRAELEDRALEGVRWKEET
ncbi:Mis12 component-domain-containing protein [Teratosphaeria destructans]|uniref:Mis12 component-domain-containing protein n=1 Tax=Teratosphaeria destructans TaxID=418781 RepID=A0A9W7SNX2_9PEZI|nr:Mis12 component-domain-containing protein [Teratosphaeria destructans]